MIPNNEFTLEDLPMPSADVMYHNYIKYYNLTVCACGREFWQKKELRQRTKCGICLKGGTQ